MSNGTKIMIKKTSNYTVMSNEHFQVKNMSLKAKGLLSLILSLPDNWDYSINGLAQLSSDGVSAVNSTLKELEELGYLKIEKELPNKDNGGKICSRYYIYEQSTTPEKLQKLTKN